MSLRRQDNMRYVDETNYSGEYVYQYFIDITDDYYDDEDGFISLYSHLKDREFRLIEATPEEVIKELIPDDVGFYEYYKSEEENDTPRYRYNDADEMYYDIAGDPVDMGRDEIHNPIIIADGELVDGYSRLTRHLIEEELDTIQAYVAIDKE